MSHKITSEDNWLVQCLFLASFGAALFFGVSSGWLVTHLGVTQVSANVYGSAMAVAPVAPVLVYETNTERNSEKKSPYSATAEVPTIVISDLKEGQLVTGVKYVTVLPKYLSAVTSIELRVNGEIQTPKESGSATYAIDTALLPEGTHTIVVDVRGIADNEEISLQKNVMFKVGNNVEAATKPVTSEYAQPSTSKGLALKLGRVFVTTDRINVRSEPNGAIITQQNAGVRGIQIADAVLRQANYEWLLVEFPGGIKGYVATDFLRPDADEVVSSPVSAQKVVDVEALQAQMVMLQKQLADMQAQLQRLLE